MTLKQFLRLVLMAWEFSGSLDLRTYTEQRMLLLSSGQFPVLEPVLKTCAGRHAMLIPAGELEVRSKHGACPVTKGEKW